MLRIALALTALAVAAPALAQDSASPQDPAPAAASEDGVVAEQAPIVAPPPAQGRLLVAVNVDDAEVLVDGQAVGRTPLAVLTLPPGRHTVAIRAVGFEPYSRSVDLTVEGARVDAYLDPTPDQASAIAAHEAEEAAAYGAAAPADPWYRKWWVWAAVGGGAVVLTAIIVGIAVAAGGGDGGTQEGFPVPPLPEAM